MSFYKKMCVCLLAAVLSIGTAMAGKMFTQPENGLRVCLDSFITDSFPEVEVLVRLLAPEKLDYRYFNGDHFGIIEEEVPVKDLRVEPFSPPMSISIVLDDSGSLENGNRYLKTAMKHFVEEMSEDDEASVTSFNRSVQVLQKMTYSKRELNKSIATIKSYGATALYDGLMAGLQQLDGARGKRIMLVVSDGFDEVYPGGTALSRFNLGNVIKTAKESGVEVYSIAVGNVEKFNELKQLSDSTNGLFWCAPSSSYLKPLFDKVTTSLDGLVKVYYKSPNANFDRKDRTVVMDVRRGKYEGRGVGTYWLDYKAPSSKLSVTRENAVDNKLSNLRLFTWGVSQLPVELEFYLYDMRGNLVRHGLTSKDGFGKLERGNAPQLTNIPSGTYRLILRREGVEIDFDHPMVVIDPSTTLTMSLGFSKVVFRRDGREWFNMTHRLGNCAELLAVSVEDLATGREIYNGLLDDFTDSREVAFWLQEGAYKVTVKNKWPVVDNVDRQNAILKAEVVSDFRVSGGQQLYFDTIDSDFILPVNVLSREYLIANADESPFKALTPVSNKEVEVLAEQQARRYRTGTFTRHKEHYLDSDSLYTHLGSKSLDDSITRLMEERVPDRTTRVRTDRANNEHFTTPYHNSSLNNSHRTINNGYKPTGMTPPVYEGDGSSYESSWQEENGTEGTYEVNGREASYDATGSKASYDVSDTYDKASAESDGAREIEIFDDGSFSGREGIKQIDHFRPSKAEELRIRARQIISDRVQSQSEQREAAAKKAADLDKLSEIYVPAVRGQGGSRQADSSELATSGSRDEMLADMRQKSALMQQTME